MTLTVELPAELERRLRAMPESERQRFAVAALSDWLAALEEVETEGDPHDVLRAANRSLTAEELESLGRSLADGDAGREVEGDIFFSELRAPLKASRE
jgi:hypothetical protein